MATLWKHKVPACIANKYGHNRTSPFLVQSSELIKVKEVVLHHSGFQVMQASLWLAGQNAVCRASSQYHVLSFQKSCCKGALTPAELGMNFASWFTMLMNPCSTATFVGECPIVLVFSGSAWTPWALTMCLENWRIPYKNSNYECSM